MTDNYSETDAVKPPEAAPSKGRTPPYIAFKTFQTLLSELKTNGLPPVIDPTVLTRFAGGLQGQIVLALRSLDLVDAAEEAYAEAGRAGGGI